MSAWELVDDTGRNGTQRLKVPGGWIYKVWERNLDGDQPQDTLAAVFVPVLDAPVTAEVTEAAVEAACAAYETANGRGAILSRRDMHPAIEAADRARGLRP